MPESSASSRLPELPPEWCDKLGRAGLRRTGATRHLLQLFLQRPGWSPTHAEVEAALAAAGASAHRVTLYRLLDRLAGCGLLEREADAASRLWRFHLADGGDAPRFECDACHRQFRVAEASQSTRAAADQLLSALAALGHRGLRVELAVHGTCAGCRPRSG